MAAVAITGLADQDLAGNRIQAGVLLLAFALIMFGPFPKHRPTLLVHVRMALLAGLAAGLLSMRAGWNFFPILFFLLSPMAVMELSVKPGLIWIGIFTLITAVVFYVVNGPSGLVLLLPFAAGYVFFGMFGWMTIEAERNRARSEMLLAELQTAHHQLQEYAARLEELTIAQERNRIAREMHDTLGHRLTIASVQLEGAQRLIPTQPERAASMVGTVREQVKEGLTELRRTVAMLRASVEEDLPLDQALIRLVDQVRQATSLKIHLSLEECPQGLALPQNQALYRAVQEGLTNIQRHARASEVWLQLASQNGQVELLISDNGVGIPDDRVTAGFGLVGLQERASLLGGEFHIDPRPGGGTQMTFCIPVGEAVQRLPATSGCGKTYE